jgi:LacI family transcriptional regulator
MVFIDRKPAGWTGDVVRADNEGGAYAATRHLIDQGHRRIATVIGPIHLGTAKERLRGFRRALRSADIVLPPKYIAKAHFDRTSGFEAGLFLLRPSSRPTAVFAQNDVMAMGVLLAIRELGLRCPEDISVVGFDNLDATELFHPPLTTVDQPAFRMGKSAAELLIQRITGNTEPPKEIVLETELIRRGSVNRIMRDRQSRRLESFSDSELSSV